MIKRIHWSTIVGSLAMLVGIVTAMPAAGTEPVYSLDLLRNHPYRFQPAYGHASQRPGSPKHFVPGYGYRIPGFGQSNSRASTTTYRLHYGFGRRLPQPLGQHYLHDTNSLGGPWYHPGWPGNVGIQAQAW